MNIILEYNIELLFQKQCFDVLLKRLLVQVAQHTDDVVVDVRAITAGAPVCRAIFHFWEIMHKGGKNVVVKNFPRDSWPVVTSMGLNSLPGLTITEAPE